MSDQRLRDLERVWKESGAEQDELAYLQEQIRTSRTLAWKDYCRLVQLSVEAAADYLRARMARGDLARDKLILAAYCSHEPARLALGGAAPESSHERGAMHWVADHPHVQGNLREQFCWRAASAAVSASQESWETEPGDGGERIREVMTPVRAWLEEPEGPPPFSHLQALPIVDTSAYYSSTATVLEAMQGELVRWLLGYY